MQVIDLKSPEKDQGRELMSARPFSFVAGRGYPFTRPYFERMVYMKITCKTAESVCMGHPDKLCDLIADSILDACLAEDKLSRVACEVMATKGYILVAGEITCSRMPNIKHEVHRVLNQVGYNPFHFKVKVKVHKQSADIAGGVGHSLEARNGSRERYSQMGAGDQGTVYGYAINEGDTRLLPLPVSLANCVTQRLDKARQQKLIKGILPDGKAQVTIEYHDGVPKRVKSIVVSVQHRPDKDLTHLKNEIVSEVLWPVFDKFPFDDQTEILVNPSGRFVEGGPAADTGLTGRKLMVDTYGGLALHGGGALSGKDPTKVDRSGAYMARYIARHVVSCGYARECQVAISYAIGKADPVTFVIDTLGTSTVPDEILTKAAAEVFCIRPAAIIDCLNLRNVRYAATATYGHFKDFMYAWERTDKMLDLRDAVKKLIDGQREIKC